MAEMPKDGAEARDWSMRRLRRALIAKDENPQRREWEAINDRNNFAPGIAKSMQTWPGRTA